MVPRRLIWRIRWGQYGFWVEHIFLCCRLDDGPDVEIVCSEGPLDWVEFSRELRVSVLEDMSLISMLISPFVSYLDTL